MTAIPIRRALLSVSDKTGIVDLGKALAQSGVELVSTGGTAKALRDAGLEVRDISDLTGFPEMMDGRVKTLHPKVHGGLLAVRDDAAHAASMAEHDIGTIDLVVVNLYPFEQTVARGAERDEVIENIDIGGPSMVRSAAKNHAYVAIVTDPADYALVAGGSTTLEDRKRLAAKAYAATAAYDGAIAQWFAFVDQRETFPQVLPVTLTLGSALRYGENPHQQAAFYARAGRQRRWPGAAGAGQGTVVQQFQRCRCRTRPHQRVPRVGSERRHRQACQPLRRRQRQDDRAGLCRCVRVRHGLRVRRHHRAEPQA
jgi:phosphoribosylaminoimidazolecarboxamide formyltransferase/IMP cyclohydrolase